MRAKAGWSAGLLIDPAVRRLTEERNAWHLAGRLICLGSACFVAGLIIWFFG